MNRKRNFSRILQTMATFSCAGTLFASSCSSSEIRAVTAGIDALTQELDNNDDISFGDFLISQLD